MKQKEDVRTDHKIIKALLDKSPMSAKELMKKIPKSTVYKRLAILQRSGIIKKIDIKYAISTYNPLEEEIEKALKEVLKLIYPDRKNPNGFRIETFEEAVKGGNVFYLSESQFKELAVSIGKAPDDPNFLEVFSKVLKKHEGHVKLSFTPNVKL